MATGPKPTASQKNPTFVMFLGSGNTNRNHVNARVTPHRGGWKGAVVLKRQPIPAAGNKGVLLHPVEGGKEKGKPVLERGRGIREGGRGRWWRCGGSIPLFVE